MEASSAPVISTRPVGPFQMNTYLVGCPETGDAALIDAGGDIEWVRAELESHGLTLRLLLQTHAHIDHVAGLSDAKSAWPDVPICLHPAGADMYRQAPQMGLFMGIRLAPLPAVERDLSDGETVEVGSLRLEVLFTPGHSPGHVAFVERSHGIAFSGDLIFLGSIGRTDLPGCDVSQMRDSLRRFMTEVDPATRVLSGHGPETTLEREIASNPFLRSGGGFL